MTNSSHVAAIRPLAVTQGDPSGIGIEITLKAWGQRAPQTRPFYLLADAAQVQRCANALGLDVPIAETTPQTASAHFASSLPVVSLGVPVEGRPGMPNAADAKATILSIERAVADVHAGHAHAVVTNPISKDVLYKSGFRHPGHTEFLGDLATKHYGVAARPVMLLWSPVLAVVPVTIHVALKDVFSLLTGTLLKDTCRIVARDMTERFGISQPRLAVAGLNPHAGEAGSMGREELDIIAPALADLRAEGLSVIGPLPADTLFHASARAKYDVAVCMYHDQALIPVKTLAFDSAVNVTLGLPFVRTSPDHGTAYDIAGQGIADPASLVAALDLAGRLSSVRQSADELLQARQR